MTKDEALKLALDALENHTAIKHPQQIHYRDKAIAAIKEALAQLEQEPFGYFKAEPFGWTDCSETDEGAKALYEAPLQRKPLTVHEIAEFVGTHEYGSEQLKWFRLGEAAHGIKENT